MPNLPISGLPAASSLDGTELLPFVQGGVTTQATAQDILNANLSVTSSGITVSGDIVPTTPQGATLGTADKPFAELYLQSGSISIESDTPGDPSAIISNVDGNLEISVGGMSLIEPGNSFIAETGSFQYLSGSLNYVGIMDVDGNITFDGNSALLTASLSDTTLTFTKTDSSTFDIELPIYNNSSGSNVDSLGGVAARTLYTRNGAVSFTPGTNVDFMSGSSGDIWGSRNIPQSFLQNTDFQAKIIHFRTFGAFGAAGGSNTFRFYIQIGNDKLTSSDIGNVTLSQPDNHPFEIMGELIFTNGECTVCCSLSHCANNGDLKRYPLSNASSPDTVTSFTGGDFKLIVSGSSTNPMISYASYLQVYN
jgi:hypothetical protein